MNLRISLRWYKNETFRLFQLGLFETYGKGEPIYLLTICIAKLFLDVVLEKK